VFFAACNETRYLSLLTPYHGKSDLVTLIKSSSYKSEFDSLELPVAEIPGVFELLKGERQVALEFALARRHSNPQATRTVCKYFPKVR
jgi:hypothetical protein